MSDSIELIRARMKDMMTPPAFEPLRPQTAEQRAIGNIQKLGRIMLEASDDRVYFWLEEPVHVEQNAILCERLDIPCETVAADYPATINGVLGIVFREIQLSEGVPFAIAYGAVPFNRDTLITN